MPGPIALSWSQVLSWRTEHQFLDRPRGVDEVDVVGRLAGVQSQVASSAEQAVAVRRTEGSADITAALAERRLVRTWAARGTLHLLTAEDAAAYLALLAAARTWLKPAWQREFATADQMAAIAEATAAALDGAVLTREKLGQEISERTGDRSLGDQLASGWGAVLKPLAWQGLLCNGIPQGNRVTFTSPASWLPAWKGLPDPAAAAAVAIPAYLGAHGPADPAAFDHWLSRGAHRKTTVRGWFTDLTAAGVLSPVEVGGEPLYARTADLDALRETIPTERLRLLPGFDQYLLGPGTKDHRVLAPARRGAVSRDAGWIAPVVVVDGRVVGTWEAPDTTLAIELFEEAGPLPRAALDAEVAFLERVLGRRLSPSVVTV